jgi:D-alanyl-D-alanine carboxypeptidase/D-alanyl-D-alanine-endopeptidase (penicillin-binding protein 4)
MKRLSIGLLSLACAAAWSGCSPQHRIQHLARQHFLNTQEIQTSHAGIVVFDPEQKRSLYTYNANKYFVPASNTKIVTCYAALKHLGDSIAGIKYAETDKALWVRPTGDPTLLHRDFSSQPVMQFLRQKAKPVFIELAGWKSTAWGSGWSWDDFDQSYMAERSSLPIYGNILEWHQELDSSTNIPNASPSVSIYSYPEVNWKVHFDPSSPGVELSVTRSMQENEFFIREGKKKMSVDIPFVTKGAASAVGFLKDSLPDGIAIADPSDAVSTKYNTLFSRPLDSLLQPMMHRSDNFFAEQILLMVSERMLGEMNIEKVTDTLLRSDLSDLPQRPRWADGSGLSRYNLFSPMDIVTILEKARNEFGMERIKEIFPTGGEGTLSSVYLSEKGKIYAKTGTLSGVVALSGYLYTRKEKWIAFSVMVNNHKGTSSTIRKSIEHFLTAVQKRY